MAKFDNWFLRPIQGFTQSKIEKAKKSILDEKLYVIFIDNCKFYAFKQQNEKNFHDPISRVKFSVESKTELRIGLQHEGKPGNRKETKILVLNNQKKLKKKVFFLVFDSFVKNAVQNDYF